MQFVPVYRSVGFHVRTYVVLRDACGHTRGCRDLLRGSTIQTRRAMFIDDIGGSVAVRKNPKRNYKQLQQPGAATSRLTVLKKATGKPAAKSKKSPPKKKNKAPGRKRRRK